MSYARSFYAEARQDADDVDKKGGSPTIGNQVLPAELSPLQMQEAIRLYRQLSAVQPSLVEQTTEPVEPESTPVNSSYFGQSSGIPQSYTTNYQVTPSKKKLEPISRPTQEELIAQLQALTLSQNARTEYSDSQSHDTDVPSKIVQTPHIEKPVAPTRTVAPERPRIAYGHEESGYLFDRSKPKSQELTTAPYDPVQYSEDNDAKTIETGEMTGIPPEMSSSVLETAEPERFSYVEPSPYAISTLANVVTPSRTYKSGTSEYIGMPNDNVFFMDQKKMSYANHYTTATSTAPVTGKTQEAELSNVAAEHRVAPPTPYAVAQPSTPSRFRGWIKDVSSNLEPAAPIVVERIEQMSQYSPAPAVDRYSGAFRPVLQDANSEYQMMQLNDLTSCIEPY